MLFKKHEQLCPEYQIPKISMEMISEQPNDYIVSKLTEQFQSIIDSGVKGNEKIFKTNEQAIHNIDLYIKERFGFESQHIFRNFTPYCVLPPSFEHNNSLKNNIEEFNKHIGKLLKYRTVDKNAKVKSLEGQDAINALDNYLTSCKDLTKQVTEKPIFVDLRNAKLLNLPKNFKVFIAADLHACIHVLKFTAEELTAVLLHEIGHLFTFIEYSNRVANTTQVLIDTVRDLTLRQNKGAKETLRIVYEKTNTVSVPPEFKNMSTVKAALFVVDKTINRNVGIQNHNSIDSEQLADQFSGKFGMGNHLATALAKSPGENGLGNYLHFLNYVSADAYFLYALVSVILIVCSGVFGLAVMALLVATTLVSHLCSYIIYRLFRSDTVTGKMTYDDIRRRIVRIKNESVRLLQADLPKENKEQILNGIKIIESRLDNMKEVDIGFLEKIELYFDKYGSLRVESKRIEQHVEDLMSNELHIGTAFLNKIKE